MKLNLGLIRQSVRSDYEYCICNQTDAMTLTGVCPYVPGQTSSDDEKIYLITWEELLRGSIPIRNAVCIGGGTSARSFFEERSMQGFIFPQSVSEMELLNEFQAVFSRYTSLELDLLNAICADASTRVILNCVTEFFHCGAMLVDSDWVLLEYSDTYVPQAKVWHETIQQQRYSGPMMPREKVFMNPSKPKQYSKATFIQGEEMSPNYSFGFESEGSYFATLQLYQAEQELVLECGWLVDYIGGILKTVVSARYHSNMGLRKRVRKFLRFIYLHPNINDIMIDPSLQKIGWMEDDVYRLLLILLPNESRGISQYQYNYENIFAGSIADAIAITCDEFIAVVLHNDACNIPEDTLSTLEKQLTLDDGICSVGLKFCGIRRLVSQYVFTQIPFGMYDTEERIRYYGKIMARHFATEFNAVIGLNAVFHWAAIKIREYDDRNGTSYLSTVEAYLICDRSLNDAANRLFIHRSTMYYRMKCIERIVQIDYDDPHERLYMLLSCIALRELSAGSIKKQDRKGPAGVRPQ